MRRLGDTLAVGLVLLGAACARKEPAAKPAGAAAQAPAAATTDEPTHDDGDEAPKREPGVARTLGVMTVDEVTGQGLLPAPIGAAVLRPVGRAQVGERVEASYCFDGTPADAAATLVARYADAGWFQVTSTAHPTVPERYALAAEKPPYSLLGVVTRTNDPRCAGGQGKSLASVGVHKLQNLRAVGAPPVPGPRGTSSVGEGGQVGPTGGTQRQPLRLPR